VETGECVVTGSEEEENMLNEDVHPQLKVTIVQLQTLVPLNVML
jgi:hypothetical protein